MSHKYLPKMTKTNVNASHSATMSAVVCQ